jgi:hypothetical protein
VNIAKRTINRRSLLKGAAAGVIMAGLPVLPVSGRPAARRRVKHRRIVEFRVPGSADGLTLAVEVPPIHREHRASWRATAEAQTFNFALDPIYVIEVQPHIDPIAGWGFNPNAWSPTFGGTYASWGSYAGLVYLYDQWMSGALTAQYGVKPPPWLQAQWDAEAAARRAAEQEAQRAAEQARLDEWIQNPELAVYGGADAAVVARQMEKQGLREAEIVALIATLQAAATVIDGGYIFSREGLKLIGQGITGGTIMLSIEIVSPIAAPAAGVIVGLVGVGMFALGIYMGYWAITNLGYPLPAPTVASWSVTPYVDLSVFPTPLPEEVTP